MAAEPADALPKDPGSRHKPEEGRPPQGGELSPAPEAVKTSSRLWAYLRTKKRWLIVALLFWVAVVNNLDRQALSVLAPTLRSTLGFGAVEYSYIVTAFLLAYTLGYSFSGRVLDKLGVKIGLGVALGFWSLMGMLHAMASSWLGLACFRFLLGLGESFNSPGGVKALSEWIPPRERGLSMAIFSNGNVIGAILAPPLVTVLALQFGWRWSFIVTGALGFVLLAVWWAKYYSPESHPDLSQEERVVILSSRPANHESGEPLSMWALLRQPLCIGFFCARFLTDSVTYFFAFWLPDYLTQDRGFSLALIGLVGWLPFLASDIGGPGGGALSDWFIRRGWSPRRARLTLMGAAVCLMPLSSLAVRTPSVILSVLLIAVLLAAQSCWMANMLTLISESISRNSVGALLSLSALGGGLGGMLSTLVAGRVISQLGYVPIFTLIGFAHATAFLVIVAASWAQERGER